MRKHAVSAFIAWSLIVLPFIASSSVAQAATPGEIPEWTFMIFLNGKNNLDSYGAMNINQMEQVGSTDKLNIVVQWGSIYEGNTKRLFIKKDDDTDKVTSPVIQDMGNTDMGDYKQVVEFVKWSAKNYPAKKYFLVMWDHGSGWHDLNNLNSRRAGMQPNDISWDDETGSFITTEQLGVAIHESSAAIGQKLDIYGSDACLMSMAEVADEMTGSVETFLGSQEVEPAEGWPYVTFLQRWAEKPDSSSQAVGDMLAQEYVKAYSEGGIYNRRDVTFSVFDMDRLPLLKAAVGVFGATFKILTPAARAKIREAASNSQSFTFSDYVDVTDFILNVEKAQIAEFDVRALSAIKDAVKALVPFNYVTGAYQKATGVAFWAPSETYTYNRFSARYNGLKFSKDSGWGDALAVLMKDAE